MVNIGWYSTWFQWLVDLRLLMAKLTTRFFRLVYTWSHWRLLQILDWFTLGATFSMFDWTISGWMANQQRILVSHHVVTQRALDHPHMAMVYGSPAALGRFETAMFDDQNVDQHRPTMKMICFGGSSCLNLQKMVGMGWFGHTLSGVVMCR